MNSISKIAEIIFEANQNRKAKQVLVWLKKHIDDLDDVQKSLMTKLKKSIHNKTLTPDEWDALWQILDKI
jgi:hypothetical protein